VSLPRFTLSGPAATATTATTATPETVPVAANDSAATATTATTATEAAERSSCSNCSSSNGAESAGLDIGETLEQACAGLDLAPGQLLGALTAEEVESVGTDDLPLLALFDIANAVAATRARAEGRIPKGGPPLSTCTGCGPVYLWRGAPATVEGCPWCHERHKGRPVPRPQRVACAACSRFVPDPLGDGGIGWCEIEIPLTEPPRFPFAPRACAWWLAKEC